MLDEPGRRCALVNGRVVLPDAIVLGKAVVIEGERIAGVADAGAFGSDCAQI